MSDSQGDDYITIPVTLPRFAWGRLATIADHRGKRVADLIGDAVYQILDRDTGRLAQLQNELKKQARNKKTGPYTQGGK